MYRFSYVENVAAQPRIADRQQFLQLLRSEKVKQTCVPLEPHYTWLRFHL